MGTVAHLKFIIDDIETDHPRVYFMNISQGAHHNSFLEAAGLEWDELVRGEMVYQPHPVASDGSQGVYSFFLSPYAYQHSFDTMNRAYTLLAANMLSSADRDSKAVVPWGWPSVEAQRLCPLKC